MSKKGKIIRFEGTWDSGIAYLIIKSQNGKELRIMCENAQTVRALNNCFGNVISEGHCLNNQAICGKEIEYSVNDVGLLEWINPV